MAVTKTEVVSVRVPMDMKAALVAAAEQGRSSLASMADLMVLDYFGKHGVELESSTAAKKSRPCKSI